MPSTSEVSTLDPRVHSSVKKLWKKHRKSKFYKLYVIQSVDKRQESFSPPKLKHYLQPPFGRGRFPLKGKKVPTADGPGIEFPIIKSPVMCVRGYHAGTARHVRILRRSLFPSWRTNFAIFEVQILNITDIWDDGWNDVEIVGKSQRLLRRLKEWEATKLLKGR